jgi:hypothetical protein
MDISGREAIKNVFAFRNLLYALLNMYWYKIKMPEREFPCQAFLF